MKNIAVAFVKAKKAFAPAIKNSSNPHFKSKYADLAACIEAVDDSFLANGIVMYQETFEDSAGVTVETVLLHESGEIIRCGKLHVPASKQDAQGYGSALSYARRYSLMAACGIAPEDDDGNAASKRQNQQSAVERMPDQVLADWLSYLSESESVGDLRKRMGEAEAASTKDPEALAQIRSAFNAKLAQAKAPAKG